MIETGTCACSGAYSAELPLDVRVACTGAAKSTEPALRQARSGNSEQAASSGRGTYGARRGVLALLPRALYTQPRMPPAPVRARERAVCRVRTPPQNASEAGLAHATW